MDSLPVPTRGSAPGSRAQAPGAPSGRSLLQQSCETLATTHLPGKTRQESGATGGPGQGRVWTGESGADPYFLQFKSEFGNKEFII